jgi:hypothetical protein
MMVRPGARWFGASLLVVLAGSLLADAHSLPAVGDVSTPGRSTPLAVSTSASDGAGLAPAFGGSLPDDLRVFHFGGARTAAAAPGQTQQLQFRCPSSTMPESFPDPQNLGDKTTYGCPYRVYDGADAKDGFPLGNPQIAVNPSNEAEAAFVSLHDQPAANGPTPRARAGLTHTTFTTSDQGLNWEDQPTQYGGSADGVAYLGESASIAMDPQGNMYIAYLWVLPNGNATTGYGGAIGLFKAGAPHDRGTVSASYSNQKTITSRSSHNIIPRVDVLYVPPYQAPQSNVTVDANGTLAPATDAEVGQEAVVLNHTRERVAVVWFERAVDYRNSTTGMAGWIDAAVADTSSRNSWQRLDKSQLIGPCRDASNPVAWNGLVYVACQADRGYTARSRARIGDIDVWALDPITHNTTLVSSTGLRGGHPMLAATPDGYMALLAVTHRADQTLDVNTAYGWYGRGWTARGNIGPELHRLGGSIALLDASVNALAVSEREKTVAIVYMEWAQRQGALPSQPGPAVPDPANPAAPTPVLTDFRKFIVAFNECQFPIAQSQMQLGTSVDPNNLNAYMKQASIFDDFQDGLVAYREPSGEDLFYFAIDDYGAMQYGAVVTQAASAFCPGTPPLFSASPAAIPQALATGTTASVTVGAVVGVAAVAMVSYLLTVKRRVAHFAVAEDK